MNSEEAVEDLVLEGHTDLITGLAISPDGNHLLSNRFVTATPSDSLYRIPIHLISPVCIYSAPSIMMHFE